MTSELNFPLVPPDKLTPDVLRKIDALMQFIGAQPRTQDSEPGTAIPRGTLSRWKSDLRKMFALSARTPFDSILNHPQLRAAVENIVVRSQRSDRHTLRAGRSLGVVAPNGEILSVENFVKSFRFGLFLNTLRAWHDQDARIFCNLVAFHE